MNDELLINVASPLLPDNTPQSIYDKGFAYFAEKRRLAKEHGALWLLKYQLAQLEKLKYSARFGLFWTCTYAFAVGAGLAGYFVVTIGVENMTQGWSWLLLSVPIIAGMFSGLLNFWIARKEPTEMVFDLMKGEDAQELSRPKKILAGTLAFLYTSLLTGLCAYGMLAFFGAVMDVDAGWVDPVKYGFTALLATIFFIPEISICHKFNKKWLKDSPYDHYKRLCRDVNNDSRYLLAYVACLSCVLVGAIFTALATADTVSSIMPFEAAVTLLTLISLTGISFYADKAYTQVTALYQRNNGIAAPEKQHSPGVKLTRTMNALGNAVPAFLGGMAVGGFQLAIFTAICGFVTSFLSGADGQRDGYEGSIQKECIETQAAIKELKSSSNLKPEPNVTVASKSIPATQCATLFTPFYRKDNVRMYECELISGRPAVLV